MVVGFPSVGIHELLDDHPGLPLCNPLLLGDCVLHLHLHLQPLLLPLHEYTRCYNCFRYSSFLKSLCCLEGV